MDKKNLEIRNLGHVEVRDGEDSRHISGYAVVFNSPSVDMGFREIIEPTAITQELVDASDVYLNLNHNDNKILGRWNQGKGSLTLTLDEKGLKFDIDAPNTDLGDTVLEYLRRGDIDKCSFAFCMDGSDESETWEQSEDGTVLRTIHHIALLHDVSVVWNPAYDETSVSARSLEKLQQFRDTMKEDEKDPEVDPKDNEDPKDQEKKEEPKDNEDPKEEPKDNEDPKEEPKDNEDPKEEPKEEKKSNKSNITKKTMEKKFNLLSAIRSVAENKPFDAETQAVVEAGKAEMRAAGVSINGQIQLPVENRTAVTVAAEGEDVVVTDFANILEPLRTKNVLADSGANILTGLVGDLQIPAMGKENVNWEGETDEAKDGAAQFTNVKLTPHRLSAFIDVSKQFLVQDSLGAEALIRRDLVNAIQSKLEDTIFGTDEAEGGRPAGIFASKTPTEVTDFKSLVTLESDVEDANFYGEAKYILSPKAKAALRAMAKSTKSTQLVLEGDNIDGTPVLSTGHIAKNTFAYGDWSSLYVGQWGAIDLTVDPYTKAADGQVRIVINAYFDFKVARDGGIVYGTVAGK